MLHQEKSVNSEREKKMKNALVTPPQKSKKNIYC
jgi:hypothetical protein